MSDGMINDISLALGRLEAGLQAVDLRIATNHSDAEKHWGRLESDLDAVKFEQRAMEKRRVGQSEAIRRIGNKLRPLEDLPRQIDGMDRRIAAVEASNTRVDKLDERLGSIERLAYKLAGVAAAVAAIVTLLGPIIIHYGGEFVRWATGKTP